MLPALSWIPLTTFGLIQFQQQPKHIIIYIVVARAKENNAINSNGLFDLLHNYSMNLQIGLFAFIANDFRGIIIR